MNTTPTVITTNYRIHASLPPTPEYKFRKNIQVNVLAADIKQAIAKFEAAYPLAVVDHVSRSSDIHRMKSFELTADEAWAISGGPVDEWDFKKLKVLDRSTSEFRNAIRELSGQGVTFTYQGDEVAFARVTQVCAPWDLPEWWEGEPETKNRWTICLDPECFRRMPTDNTGYWQHRIADHIQDDQAHVERCLAEEWRQQNELNPGCNFGLGTLQDLMISTFQNEKPEGFEPWLTNRERKIVATIIQWLGTNCGRGFLYAATQRMGRPQYMFYKQGGNGR